MLIFSYFCLVLLYHRSPYHYRHYHLLSIDKAKMILIYYYYSQTISHFPLPRPLERACVSVCLLCFSLRSEKRPLLLFNSSGQVLKTAQFLQPFPRFLFHSTKSTFNKYIQYSLLHFFNIHPLSIYQLEAQKRSTREIIKKWN